MVYMSLLAMQKNFYVVQYFFALGIQTWIGSSESGFRVAGNRLWCEHNPFGQEVIFSGMRICVAHRRVEIRDLRIEPEFMRYG